MSSRFGHFKYLQIRSNLQDIAQKLYFNAQLAHSYTHVLISHLDSNSILQTLLEVLCPYSEPAEDLIVVSNAVITQRQVPVKVIDKNFLKTQEYQAKMDYVRNHSNT